MLREILTARTRPSDKALYNIWARKISGGWAETTLTGTLPLAFLSKTAQTLTDYRIYGTAAGAGEQTSGTEPAGYKIPLTVESEEESTTTPIYIGASKLMAEEYVDYESGKVYKKSSDIWDETLTAWNSAAHMTVVNNGDGSFTLSKSSGAGAYPSVKIGQVLERGKNYVLTFTISGMTQAMLGRRPTVNVRDRRTQTVLPKTSKDITGDGTYVCAIYNVPNVTCVFCILLAQNDASIAFSNVVVSDITIQEIVPQDPPVPLPPIPTYQGENTLSSTETVGNVSVAGKIKEVTP